MDRTDRRAAGNDEAAIEKEYGWVINHRQMGEAHGYWIGKEVEHTQFYGLETIFFSRMRAARNMCIGTIREPHVFLAIINPKFLDGYEGEVGVTALAEMLLAKGKKVTIEAGHSSGYQFMKLRAKYPSTFCLLIVLEVSKPFLGGFAVKVAPEHVFQDFGYEHGVMTVPFERLKEGTTLWKEYEEDQDGV